MQKVRVSPNQVLKSYSFALHESASAATALEAACTAHGGRSPNALFLCAGGSTPGFFVEADEASLKKGMDMGYWVQAWTALVSRLSVLIRLRRRTICSRQVRSAWPASINRGKLYSCHPSWDTCPLLDIVHIPQRSMHCEVGCSE